MEYSYPLPFSQCDEYTITVTPVNVAGNGTQKSLEVIVCGGKEAPFSYSYHYYKCILVDLAANTTDSSAPSIDCGK